MLQETRKAKIAFEDGTIFEGFSFGAEKDTSGEVVFNTSMAGYQEILTDPSYKGQIVTMTYPLIGNYGVNLEDVESSRPFAEGFIVREASRIPSNWRAASSLQAYLKKHGIAGIEGVDTRAITRHIRLAGAMKAVISTQDLDNKRLVKKAKESRGLIGVDLVKEVTCAKRYNFGDTILNSKNNKDELSIVSPKLKVVVLDCGVKFNILRNLAQRGCEVIVVPAQATAAQILAEKPDGVILSNGPGDPAAVPYVVKTTKGLLGKVPVFGICLGHQMLGQAWGGKTFKLKFGHHGGNHPVKDLKSGRVAITAQNHGFCVDIQTLPKGSVEITHINLYDNTLEGMRHTELPVFSVQYHPEAGPGPHDAEYLFDEFIKMMEKYEK